MLHIRQKNLNPYTVVKTDNWDDPLSGHPSITDHPELFEIADCDIPDDAQFLDYETN